MKCVLPEQKNILRYIRSHGLLKRGNSLSSFFRCQCDCMRSRNRKDSFRSSLDMIPMPGESLSIVFILTQLGINKGLVQVSSDRNLNIICTCGCCYSTDEDCRYCHDDATSCSYVRQDLCSNCRFGGEYPLEVYL